MATTNDQDCKKTEETILAETEDQVRFFEALFAPSDYVLFRPIETYTEKTHKGNRKRSRVVYKSVRRIKAEWLRLRSGLRIQILKEAESEKSCVFFSVCPRRYTNHKQTFDLAWQIRTVRVLWADLDHTTVEEALTRCTKAGLPRPSVIVRSGNGVHLYWILADPYHIDDAGDPPPVYTEFVEVDGKKRPRQYRIDVQTNEHVYEYLDPQRKQMNPAFNIPLTAKAQHIQHIVAGLSAKIGGDNTQDLPRLLRVPCTMNRKFQRNGRDPIPCALIECDSTRRYPLADFEGFAEVAPEKVKTKQAAKVRLKSGVKLTPHRLNKLNNLINQCIVAGDRSKADFALCCHAVRQGLEPNEVWTHCKDVSKFAERGRSYFDDTWKNAKAQVQADTYVQAQRRTGIKIMVKQFSSGVQEAMSGEPHATETSGTSKPTPAAKQDDRPTIYLCADEHEVNDQAAEALTRDFDLYQRAGMLVHVIKDPVDNQEWLIWEPGAPRIVALPGPVLRDRLSRAAKFISVKQSEEGESEQQQHPPDYSVSYLLSRGHWPGIRSLEGVIQTPVLRADGTIISQPGYDHKTGLLLEPGGIQVNVPEAPDRGQIVTAADAIFNVVKEFPFKTSAHKSTFLALVLTPLARYAFPGPVPLFLVDANIRGSGKGLLVDCASLIATGRTIPRMTQPESDDECRKRITALAINGDPLVLIDNIDGNLGCASLDAALTSTTWQDRILGRSEMVEMPLRAVWTATGNNVVLQADTARRVAHIRLESREENPEERQGFEHPNLRNWIRQERARLLSAALTILVGYFRAGRPDQKLKPWGSFEDWSDVVRSAIYWTGLDDPGAAREEIRNECDQEANALKAIIDGIEFLQENRPGILVSELLAACTSDGVAPAPKVTALREAILTVCSAGRGKDFPSTRSIGMKLHHLRGRVVAGRYLHRGEEHNTAIWGVKKVDSRGD